MKKRVAGISSCVSCVNRKGITQTYKARIYIIRRLIFRGLIKKVKRTEKNIVLATGCLITVG